MATERAATTRARLAGRICALCRKPLDPPPWGRHGERTCPACDINAPRHRILMNFQCGARPGWHVAFLEADCRTSLRARFTFAGPEKIVELAKRGGADLTSETRSMLDHGIAIGRGGVWLNLTPTQYGKLKQR